MLDSRQGRQSRPTAPVEYLAITYGISDCAVSHIGGDRSKARPDQHQLGLTDRPA